MPGSIIQAIREGDWEFEPEQRNQEEYDCTRALPGSDEKVKVLAARIAQGLPLWHPSDRRAYREDDD